MSTNEIISVIGLGYVGLPLAVELSKYFTVNGFDVNPKRVATLNNNIDPNGEVEYTMLKESSLNITSDPNSISKADYIIIAVPTPVDEHHTPNLEPILNATETVALFMKQGAIVVYESTVYPGVTEEICVPVLERVSGMTWKTDFFVGYSPERINPGDKVHTFTTIKKIVSGDTPKTLERISSVYTKAVKAGVHHAESIMIAEAAKVIENTQRDINIALMNELRIIFDKIGIPTNSVLKAANTKWNFIPFEPGLVGGHCIGVDPYYIAYKAEALGYHPQVIMSGRRINDSMGAYFGGQVVKKMIAQNIPIKGCRVIVLGITFKENVPDIRNSKVIDIIHELNSFGIIVDVWDPIASPDDVAEIYGIELVTLPPVDTYHEYDGAILAVKHEAFINHDQNDTTKTIYRLRSTAKVFFDLKEALDD